MTLNNAFHFSLWAACALLFSVSSSARTYDDIIQTDFITVAVYRDFVPFSFQENGKDLGIDVEIAAQIAKQLGVTLKLKWATADESVEDDLRNNIWKGHFIDRTVADLMLRVPYDKKYRLKRDDIGELVNGQVHMFAPYHVESWQIVFDQANIESVPTIAVFQYHDIGVENDSIPQFYLMSAFRGRMRDRSKQFATIPLAIQAMQAKKVDAVMGMRSQISYYQSHLDTQRYLLAQNGFPNIGKQKWDIGMAVKAEYRQLGYVIGDIVEQMTNDGTIDEIFNRYRTVYEIPDYYAP
ncbi:substrate-binding periplasmic protein [Paraglaciecola chathamensis]|uniref:substrate-binding periplasmic protein n=1 Tax=Paraglaciecola chathamensis TaxID=368405 RepID=UPI0026F64D00|nr:transporter substrate-binding domain-containing protein [Paraglaciecola chathamensis]MDO6558476.1 transporter substrate-binding domain-containing protein [Paraglaciecola chathamensis]